MKKAIAALLCLVFALCICGCSDEPATAPDDPESQPEYNNPSDPSERPDDGIIGSSAGGLTGIARTPATEAYEDGWGVKLTAKDITPTGLTLVCTQQDGQPSGELQTGSPFYLEVLKDGEWVSAEMLPLEYELAWTGEAWMIPSNETTEWTVDWSGLYGALSPGSYRISKAIMDFRQTGDYDEKNYYAGFDIVEAGDGAVVSYEYNGYGIQLPYVDGWEYSIEEYADGSMSYGVSYRPAGEDGWIHFHYWQSFGVCGTGLATEEYDDGTMGTYDGHEAWDFISFPANEGNFVAMSENVGGWWETSGEAAMEILSRARRVAAQ